METLINIRSETAFAKKAFEGTKRCIVPANGWYEWTGKARRKTAWRIRPNEGGLLGFAALYDVWVAPGGQELCQLATLTTEPSKDVNDIHHRMGALLRRDQFETWLNAGNDEAAGLLKPYPDGRLTVEEAVGVDWNGA
jgi:putative SOS response-associated peptidase YedK